jgi:hypothetical protein
VKVAMDNSILEKASTYDKNGLKKLEIDKAIGLLRVFRAKFPFAENPELIDSLNPDDIFRENPDRVGEFFRYLEYYLEPLGHLTIHGSIVYCNIKIQIEDFKDLLYIVVDKKKSLAEKVDAPWEKISRLGGDKHIGKKIIFCFNYESGEVLPIFKTSDMEHFLYTIVDKPSFPARYNSPGEKYEYLTSELLKAKDNLPVTQSWEITYFARFLYDNYPPPERDTPAIGSSGERKPRNTITKEQLDFGEFAKLLAELQRKGKITGQQFREYRDLWVHQPQEREALTQRLKNN